GIALARAKPIVVFPVPEGPTNSHAEGKGFCVNACKTAFGFSKPANDPMESGRYLSVRDCGKVRSDCTGHQHFFSTVHFMLTAILATITAGIRFDPVMFSTTRLTESDRFTGFDRSEDALLANDDRQRAIGNDYESNLRMIDNRLTGLCSMLHGIDSRF